MKKLTKPPSSPPADRVEQIWEGARDVADIARDLKRRDQLRSYTGEDEITQNGSREVHVTVHAHAVAPTASKPDGQIETETTVALGPVKLTGLPKWAIAALGVLVAAITAAASRLLAK